MATDPHHRAKAYPYARPDHSYVFSAGGIRPLGQDETGEDLLDGRTAVLAFGSNAAPEQLTRKFSGRDGDCIPVLRAVLSGFDVVYSAHLTSYGAVPATLAPSPGTRLETWLTWLTPAQLEIMHTSEMGGLVGGAPCGATDGAAVNYAYGILSGLDLAFENGLEAIGEAGAYLSNHGTLGAEEGPLALSQTAARNRRFASLSKIDVLEVVRDQLAPEMPLDDFITSAVSDASRRAAWTDQLRRLAQTLEISNFAALIT